MFGLKTGPNVNEARGFRGQLGVCCDHSHQRPGLCLMGNSVRQGRVIVVWYTCTFLALTTVTTNYTQYNETVTDAMALVSSSLFASVGFVMVFSSSNFFDKIFFNHTGERNFL
jgi:hypothetical protein